MRWLIAVLLCTTVATSVASCGQKGPLRLPDEQAPSGQVQARHAF